MYSTHVLALAGMVALQYHTHNKLFFINNVMVIWDHIRLLADTRDSCGLGSTI